MVTGSSLAAANRVLMFVAAITGNWGRRGGTFFNMSANTPIAPDAPKDRRGKITRPRVRLSATGWTDAMTHGKPYPIRAMIACNNPLAQWPGQYAAREAFKALDLIVHIELFANETSAYADYVLPAATGIEKGEIGRANDDRRVVWIDKLIEPPGEAKADAWIWIELGKRLGFGDVLKEEWKDPRVFWDEVVHLLRPLLWPYTLGSLIGAAVLATVAYRMALLFVIRRRQFHQRAR